MISSTENQSMDDEVLQRTIEGNSVKAPVHFLHFFVRLYILYNNQSIDHAFSRELKMLSVLP